MYDLKFWKNLEVYSEVKISPAFPLIIRCDGHKFHRLSKELELDKPYDINFMKAMVETAKSLFYSGLSPVLAYIFSDEINILFLQKPFKGRIEKLNSIIPSILSSSLTLQIYEKWGKKLIVSFDSRLIPIPIKYLLGYLASRQKEAWRNHINSYAQKAMLMQKLKGLKSSQLHELVMKTLKLNLAKTPTWQRRGILIYRRKIKIRGFNPLNKVEVETYRHKIHVDWELPLFTEEEGKRLIDEILSEYSLTN